MQIKYLVFLLPHIICLSFRIDFFIESQKSKHYQMRTPICLGILPQCFDITISFTTYYTWLCTNKNNQLFSYTPSNSSSFKTSNYIKTISTNTNKNILSGPFVTDILDTEHNENIRLSFVNVYEYEDDCLSMKSQGEIGFGVKDLLFQNSTEESFTEILYKKELIDSQLVSVKYINSSFGYITVGDNYEKYPKKYISLYTTSYSIITTGRHIDSVVVINKKADKAYQKVNEVYEFNRRIMLNFHTKFIILSDEHFNEFANKTFGAYIKNNICRIAPLHQDSAKGIVCKKGILRMKLVHSAFIINFGRKTKMGINFKKLFINSTVTEEINENEVLFGLIGKNDTNDINIGHIILENYFIIFDREMRRMRFYSNSSILDENSNDHFELLIWFVFSIGLILYFSNILYELYNKKTKIGNNRISLKKVIPLQNKTFTDEE